MGEIADMMIDGTLDFFSGEYIGRGKGMPRTLDGSLPWEGPPRYNQKNKRYGVINWLKRQGVHHQETQHSIIRTYCKEIEHDLPQKNGIKRGCSYISDNFTHFTQWYKQQEGAHENH
jgi:hypothetical protein